MSNFDNLGWHKQFRYRRFIDRHWHDRRNTQATRTRSYRPWRGSRFLTGNLRGENFMHSIGHYPLRTIRTRC